MADLTVPAENREHSKLFRLSLAALLVFLCVGFWQFVLFQNRPVEDFYQPQGYIQRVKQLIQDRKLQLRSIKTSEGYRPFLEVRDLSPDEELFYGKSWLKEDVADFNDGNHEVFLVDRGKLKGINIYLHRVESPLATDWNWWGRVYSHSAEGYAYLWNSRRTLKLYRDPVPERVLAKGGQTEFRDVIYGRGHLFQSGVGISLKGRNGNRIADFYSLGNNIVFKSYSNGSCFLNGYLLPRGQEQRLEEGDLVQIHFDRNQREEFLFHDFSNKPLSFLNVLNGRVNRTSLDESFHLIRYLATGIENTVRKTKTQKKAAFDVHLTVDEDLAGVTQTGLQQFTRQLSRNPVRASCTILDATSGRILAIASTSRSQEDTNENLKLHPVGSSTKIFLAAAAAQNAPDLLTLEIDPHPPGEEKDLLGYELKKGYKLRLHSPFVGERGTTDFRGYLAKSCNRYHAILMGLSLARDSAAGIHQNAQNLFHGLWLKDKPLDQSLGKIYLDGDILEKQPDLSYFVSQTSNGNLECNNLESSELGLNLERLFDVRRKYVEGSGEFFSPEPWNLLFAKLGIQQRPEAYPALYSVMPETVNLGFNLNIDFRLDFISIIFGGANNRWNNIKLSEAISRIVTNRKIKAHFVEKISENGKEMEEQVTIDALGLNPQVREQLLMGMEGVVFPGGTAADLYPVVQELKERLPENQAIEIYGKTGTPSRREIRKGEQEIYSSVLLLSAVLRNRETGKIQDALSFSVYIEDQGEHKAVDFMKQILPRLLAARKWLREFA
jgi:cell division protein FtsI/penicillin-binding protein 2